MALHAIGALDRYPGTLFLGFLPLNGEPIIQFRMSSPLVQSPEQVPAGSAQVVLIVHAYHILGQMPRSTVQQRMQRNTLE